MAIRYKSLWENGINSNYIAPITNKAVGWDFSSLFASLIKVRRFILQFGIIFLTIVLSACKPLSTPISTVHVTEDSDLSVITQKAATEEIVPSETANLSIEALRNATYSGIFDEPITLSDGFYDGEPFVQGGSERPVVEYIDGVELFGDLNGDGFEDVVVFLIERGGGSGAFTYIAAQLNHEGHPVDAGAVRIEDRIGVKSAKIEDGQITLEIITQGPGDAACCSTHKLEKSYSLENGRLSETFDQVGELVRVTVEDLVGTSWTLISIHDNQPVLTEPVVTLVFSDNQISGSGGCNAYTAGFKLDELNPFITQISVIAASKRACSDPIAAQEGRYFSALQSVFRWGYAYGKLALYYTDDDGEVRRLLFSPSFETESAQINNQVEEVEMENNKHFEQFNKPVFIEQLESFYGPPSQNGFGSAVFFERIPNTQTLEQAALQKYRYFMGDSWDRFGEEAWMSAWKCVYTRPTGIKQDIVAELRAIRDPDVSVSVPMILDYFENAADSRAALAATFNDPSVSELCVYNLGDGGAMSGILISARHLVMGYATFLVFIMD